MGSELYGSYLKSWWGKDSQDGTNLFAKKHGDDNSHHHQHQHQHQHQQHLQTKVTPEMEANMKMMCQAQNMTDTEEAEMMNYMRNHPEYYRQCMDHWRLYQQNLQAQQLAMQQAYLQNPQQYA